MNAVRLDVMAHDPDRQAPLACLSLGSQRIRTPVDHRPKAGELRVSAGALAQLPLAREQRLGLWVSPDGRHFHLGPLLGIPLDGAGPRTGVPGLEARARAQEALAAHMIPVFFTPRRASLETQDMPAVTLRGGRWEQCRVPLPDVIYGCALERRFEPSPEDQAALQLLQEHAAIPFVNRVVFFRELEVCEALRFFPDTRRLLPETRRLSKAASLGSMLAAHRRVLVGPERPGANRTQVVCCMEQGAVWARRCLPGEGNPVSYSDVAHLFRDLVAWQGQERWVIRQAPGFPLDESPTYCGWAAVRKNSAGKWQVPQFTVRRDGDGAGCGETEDAPWAAFLDRLGKSVPPGPDLEATLVNAARRSIRALEAHFGLLGELALTLAVDGQGRPWLLEADPQPRYAWTRKSSPLDYARSLAIKAWKARDESIAMLYASYGEVHPGNA